MRNPTCFRTFFAPRCRTGIAAIVAALLIGLKPAVGAVVAHEMPVSSPAALAVDDALVQGDWSRDVRVAPLATFLRPAQAFREAQAMNGVMALAQQLTASLNEVSLRFAISAVRRARHLPFMRKEAQVP